MKILITGIHGFVGSNLTDYLQKKHQIYGLDITSAKRNKTIETYKWDELEHIPQVDVIIHLAGKAHDTKQTSKAEEYFSVNVGLTKRIFDCFLRSETSKFIYFSSVKAIADSVENEILTEEDTPKPKTPYGKSKLEAEQFILSQTVPLNKQVYILRPAMIHGPGNKGNLNLLYSIVIKGLPYPLGAFENLRSFTSIQNLNYIIENLISREIESNIFQVADDQPLSTNEIVRLMAEVNGRKPRVWKFPVKFIKVLANIGDLIQLPFNSDRLQKLTENYVVSNRKLKQQLQIELPVSSRDGLLHTLLSFKANKSNKNNNGL